MKNISKLLALGLFAMSLTATSVFAEIKAGITLGQGVWAASGEEQNLNNTSTDTAQTGSKSGSKNRKGHGAFADSVASIFIEYDHGPVSIGIAQHGDVTTPEATNIQQSDASGSTRSTNTAKATFSHEQMLYVIVDLPFFGAYVKAGMSRVDVETQESLGTGAVYPDTNTDGQHIGFGFERELEGLSVRFEVLGSEYDDVSASDSNSASDETAKVVKVSEMIGARATISILKTF